MFGDQKLAEKRYPTREELDQVALEHPLLLKCSAHAQIVNTCAMNTAKIKAETPDPPVAKIGRNEDTGALKEMVRFLPLPPHSYEEIKDTIRTALVERWLTHGITTAFSYADGVELRIYQELLNEGALPLRVLDILM